MVEAVTGIRLSHLIIHHVIPHTELNIAAPYLTRVVLFSLLFPGLFAFSQTDRAGFEYSPSHYFTAICFPEDWQKTMVDEKGALLYDFGPGPYAKPLTQIFVGVQGVSSRVIHQTLGDPAIPIVSTTLVAGKSTIHQTTFSILPTDGLLPVSTQQGVVQRIGGLNGCIGWAKTAPGVDPAFNDVAWGTNRPIRYRVKVEKSSRKLVALGLCESYKGQPGTRTIELRVEGAIPVVVDPLAGGNRNEPHVTVIKGDDANGDGFLEIEAHAPPNARDPNVILSAFWIFPDTMQISTEAIIRGELSRSAEVYHNCGTEAELQAPSPRMDAIIATFDNESAKPAVFVHSRRSLAYDESSGIVTYHGHPFVMTQPKALGIEVHADTMMLTMPPGTKQVSVVAVEGSRNASLPFPDLDSELGRTRRYWKNTHAIPRRPLVVPDSGLQFLLDANIRNMYQVADVVDGHFQFQPGPTVYRGLWLADVILTGEVALMLGDTASFRAFLEGAMHNQLPSGQMRVMYPTQSLVETPTFIHAVCTYAQWTNNNDWLRSHWGIVTGGIQWIEDSRAKTLVDSTLPYFGLMPPGFVDGGIAVEKADYGTTLWAMIAIEKGIEAANWLGDHVAARNWQMLFDEFMASFKKAARRDLHRDFTGHLYLPIAVGDTSRNVPQRGQFAFLLPLPYGSFFLNHDELLDSIIHANLAMLDETTREGLIANSGWMQNGVWPWLGGIHGIAHHLVGDDAKAIKYLYSFANHASPVGTWVEEQQQKVEGGNTSGDCSNAEASAIFVHFLRNLLVREHGDNIEFLSGVPAKWIHPGATMEVNNGLTAFGPTSLNVEISPDGASCEIVASTAGGRTSGKPVLILAAFKESGFKNRDGSELPNKLESKWGEVVSLHLRRP